MTRGLWLGTWFVSLPLLPSVDSEARIPILPFADGRKRCQDRKVWFFSVFGPLLRHDLDECERMRMDVSPA